MDVSTQEKFNSKKTKAFIEDKLLRFIDDDIIVHYYIEVAPYSYTIYPMLCDDTIGAKKFKFYDDAIEIFKKTFKYVGISIDCIIIDFADSRPWNYPENGVKIHDEIYSFVETYINDLRKHKMWFSKNFRLYDKENNCAAFWDNRKKIFKVESVLSNAIYYNKFMCPALKLYMSVMEISDIDHFVEIILKKKYNLPEHDFYI